MASGNEVEGVEKIADLATVESSFEEKNGHYTAHRAVVRSVSSY